MHWDGYFDGVGNELVAQMKTLLEKYSAAQIEEMIEKLDIDYESSSFSTFIQSDLAAFIEGREKYANNPCEDVEYTYTIDANKDILKGRHCGTHDIRELSFNDILADKNFTNLANDDSDDESAVKKSVEPKISNIPYMSTSGLIAILQKEIEKNPKLADEPVRYNVNGAHVAASSVSISAIYNKSGYINYNIVLS
jgi:hypothetical protein